MEYYGKYGMVIANPYKYMQHKTFHPHHFSPVLPQHPPQKPPSSRPLRKSIMPFSSYIPPPMFCSPFHRQTVPPSQLPPQSPPIMHPVLPRSIENIFGYSRAVSSPPTKKTMFSAKDIDTVLYGYLRDENNKESPFHSLSGIHLISTDSKSSHEQPIQISHPNLPTTLSIKEIRLGAISHAGVFAKETIPKGTQFGPFKGKILSPRELDPISSRDSWEVFSNGKMIHYISATGCHENWMKYINCARYNKEQNMCVLQRGLDVYYETIEDINVAQELLTWYGNDYTKYMELPITMKNEQKNTTIIGSSEGVKTIERPFLNNVADNTAGSYPCNRCGKIFSYAYYREKHLKYTRCVDKGDRKFPCHLCQRSFEKKDRLRIHILHVHQKYRPHVCKTCGKRFSQSSSLNKHSRVHTGERPYACPHCPKSFTASSILRTHLRQHNGERPFKCKFCGKTFASHAAHDSHVKRTHEKLKTHRCHVCKKTFSMEFELKFHLSTHTILELENAKIPSAVAVIGETYSAQIGGRGRAYSDESDTSLVIDIEEEPIGMDL